MEWIFFLNFNRLSLIRVKTSAQVKRTVPIHKQWYVWSLFVSALSRILSLTLHLRLKTEKFSNSVLSHCKANNYSNKQLKCKSTKEMKLVIYNKCLR